MVNSDLPKYMNDILHVSVARNGLYSALPKVLSIFVSLSTGFVSDYMHAKRGVSLTKIRKIFVALGIRWNKNKGESHKTNQRKIPFSASIFPAIFVIAASYAGCNEALAVTFLTIAVGGHGFNAVGTVLNLYDLGPNYIASLTGVVNSVSCMP